MPTTNVFEDQLYFRFMEEFNELLRKYAGMRLCETTEHRPTRTANFRIQFNEQPSLELQIFVRDTKSSRIGWNVIKQGEVL